MVEVLLVWFPDLSTYKRTLKGEHARAYIWRERSGDRIVGLFHVVLGDYIIHINNIVMIMHLHRKFHCITDTTEPE